MTYRLTRKFPKGSRIPDYLKVSKIGFDPDTPIKKQARKYQSKVAYRKPKFATYSGFKLGRLF